MRHARFALLFFIYKHALPHTSIHSAAAGRRSTKRYFFFLIFFLSFSPTPAQGKPEPSDSISDDRDQQ
jgi:hypothetical protein